MITDLSDITSFKWATVTATAPLAIKLDGDTAALALIPDSLVDPLSLSTGDRVRVELSLRRVVVHGVANAGVESGRVELTATSSAPSGWLLCQGQSLLRASYPRLFAAIGTAYGTVDSTRFTLPDLRGRVAAGYTNAQTEFTPLGFTGGAKTHTLSTAEIPAHTHTQTAHNHSPLRVNGTTTLSLANAAAGSGTFGLVANASGSAIDVPNTTAVNQNTGGGGAHNNLQPYIALNYIIKI